MRLSAVAVRNYDSRLLVVPLVRKDMIVGADPAQAALVNEVIIQCASLSWTEDALNFTFTVAIMLTFIFVNNFAFWLFTPYNICKQRYGKILLLYFLCRKKLKSYHSANRLRSNLLSLQHELK